MIDLTQEELKEILYYNPDTGIFTWKVGNGGNVKIGDVAGCKESYPSGNKSTGKYAIRITFQGSRYPAHRLAWFYMTGAWPKGIIDHINRDPWDNKWLNLRDVDSATNSKNRSVNKNNKSGVTGVFWNKVGNNWIAQIKNNSVNIRLGYFKELHDAVVARREAEKEYGFHPTHGKRVANKT